MTNTTTDLTQQTDAGNAGAAWSYPEHVRPSCGTDGRQLAPEVFARWLGPCAWEDTAGAMHVDIPMLLAELGGEDTPEAGITMAAYVGREMRRLAPGSIVEERL